MKALAHALQAIAVTLWAGGLWTVGLLVAPTLFKVLPERHLAGMVAGHLFTAMAWTGIACGTYLLVYRLARYGAAALRQFVFWLVVAMLLLVAAGEFGIQPILAGLKDQAGAREVMASVVRDRFAAWHGVASVLYLILSALGVALALAVGRGR